MKIWTSQHTFESVPCIYIWILLWWFCLIVDRHPWPTVVAATWRKYPNPMNPAVVGIDVVDRRLESGVLKSHRLISSEWCLPGWATRILGADKTCFASEHSEVDPQSQTMTLRSKNVSCVTHCNPLSHPSCCSWLFVTSYQWWRNWHIVHIRLKRIRLCWHKRRW